MASSGAKDIGEVIKIAAIGLLVYWLWNYFVSTGSGSTAGTTNPLSNMFLNWHDWMEGDGANAVTGIINSAIGAFNTVGDAGWGGIQTAAEEFALNNDFTSSPGDTPVPMPTSQQIASATAALAQSGITPAAVAAAEQSVAPDVNSFVNMLNTDPGAIAIGSSPLF